MKTQKIVAGHYTALKDGIVYDIKRKSYKVGKGTIIYRWHIYQGETHIEEMPTLGDAKDFLMNYKLKVHPHFQAMMDKLLV